MPVCSEISRQGRVLGVRSTTSPRSGLMVVNMCTGARFHVLSIVQDDTMRASLALGLHGARVAPGNSHFRCVALYSGERRNQDSCASVGRGERIPVTEIPEHLLKRSKERRAAAGGGDSADAAGASSTPATTQAGGAGAATPAVTSKAAVPAAASKPATPAAPPPPKPDPAYIAAARSRKKIPFWAMATLSLLPIWGFMYVQGLKPEAKVVAGPIGAGQKIYSSCATCHGAAGGGGAGRAFTGGALQKTFPHIEDQLNLVYTGSQAYQLSGVGPYGDASLNHLGYNGAYMPSQKANLTEAEMLAVVCHERYDLAGVSPEDTKWAAEYTEWCSPESAIYAGLEDGSLTFDNLADKIKGILPVGTEPRAGTPAG